MKAGRRGLARGLLIRRGLGSQIDYSGFATIARVRRRLHVFAIVVDHLILQATELGLGTCWIADFRPEAVREVLNLPPELVPLILTPLGYPGSEARPKKRRDLSNLVYWDKVS